LQLPPAINPIGFPFIELQSVDSTNKYAMSLVHQGRLPEGQYAAQHGLAVFAHEQTKGKGQRGKSWSSEKGSGISLSIIINPYPLMVSEVFRLNICIAVSVYEFFRKYAGDETKVKWPNDLYWRDRKAGGILIENVVRSGESGVGNQEWGVRSQKLTTGNWQLAIVGIGLNINQAAFPADLPNPVSLKQITGKSFDAVELAEELCVVIDSYFHLLLAGKFDSVFQAYQAILYKKGEKVKLKKGNRVFEATIAGVAETGQLITRHAIEERFEFGEVEWVNIVNES
jgi:BirA family biotin operon repressor/biotin-[acetyl-CoA-carboxylase] ligase